MKTADKQNTRRNLENALFVAAMWGGAWILGFFLGVG